MKALFHRRRVTTLLCAVATQVGGELSEWELFDCERDPLELINCHDNPAYRDIVVRMTALLEQKMAEIGDEAMHPRSVIGA